MFVYMLVLESIANDIYKKNLSLDFAQETTKDKGKGWSQNTCSKSLSKCLINILITYKTYFQPKSTNNRKLSQCC